jgi:hypothetical protein
MDIDTSYYTILTRIQAVQTIILLPLYLYALLFPPARADVEFPSPLKLVLERKAVSVPQRPSSSDIRFLLLTFLSEILLLYPYTYHGKANLVEAIKSNSKMEAVLVFCIMLVGFVHFFIRSAAAIGWSGMRPNWLAAERGHGLWQYPAWSCYYMSFILTGTAIGIGLLMKLGWLVLSLCTEVGVPLLWDAYYQAYVPLWSWLW